MNESRDDSRTDQQLVAAINAGDANAFDALYFRYRDWVVRLAVRFTGHNDDALDVMQETFAYVFRKFPGFRLTAAMTTFLYPVVKNLSIALAAKRRRAHQLFDERALDHLPAANPAGDARADLAAALASLPETHREVLLMRFVDGLSLLEIAAALSIPEGTVKSRLHNALATLRDDERARRHFL